MESCAGNACAGNSCAGCYHLRSDMTHITVGNKCGDQLVTIDMPMDEAKRITVRQNVTVVENREFCDCGSTVSHCPAPKKQGAQAEDKAVKPIVVPSGVAKPVSTCASAVKS